MSRKATIAGASNIILGGKSIIQNGTRNAALTTRKPGRAERQGPYSVETCAGPPPVNTS